MKKKQAKPFASVAHSQKQALDLKSAEEKLRASEKQYRTLVEGLDICLCRWLPDTTLTFVSEKCGQLLGLQHEPLGKKWRDCLPEAMWFAADARMAAQGLNPQPILYQRTHSLQDGSLREYQWSDTPILDELGQVLEIQSIGLDVTDRQARRTPAADLATRPNAVFDTPLRADSPVAVSLTPPEPVAESAHASHFHISQALLLAGMETWQYDLVTGQIHWSPEAARIFGAAPRPDNLDTFLARFHPADREKVHHRLQEALAHHEMLSLEARMLDAQGKTLWVTCYGQVINAPTGNPVAVWGLLQDITQRKDVEQALSESEELYRLTLGYISDAVLITDAGGSFTFVCPNVGTIFGYELAEVVEMQKISRLLGDHLFDPLALEQSGEIANIERTIIDKWGREHVILVTVKRILLGQGTLLYTCHDVSERKQVEQALRESEARFRNFVEQSVDGFMLTDEQGTIVEWNPAVAQFTGLAREKALGTSIWELQFSLTAPEKRLPLEQIRAYLQSILETGQSPALGHPAEAEIQTAQGERRFIQLTSFPISSAQGYQLGAIIRDVTRQKQMQDALEAESVRRRVLFEESPDGILIVDPQSAGFVEFNSTAHRQLGYSREEFSRLRIYDVDAQETSAETRLHIDEVIRAGKADFETLQRTRQGEIRNVHVTAQMVEVLGQPVYYCTWRDVTDRKRAEEARRESDDRYHLLFQSMVQGVVFQDGEGHIIQANPAAERILGLSFAQMQGRASIDPSWHAIHKDGSPFPGESHPAMLALQTGEIVRDVVMGVFNPAMNAYRWININAVPRFMNGSQKPYQVYATFEDISERIQVEDKLRESEKNYRELINGMNDTVWVIDFDTSILDVNRAASSVLGYSREELLTMKINDIDVALRPEQIRELVNTMPRDRVQIFETRHTTRAGVQIPVEISSSLVSYMGRTVIMSIARDITERKLAENALVDREQQLKSLIDSQSHFVIRVNMAGKCSYWNAQFEKEFGWIYADMGGIGNANILNSVCQHHHKRVQEVVVHCIARPGEVFSVEIDKPARDGGIRTTLWEFMCLTNEALQPTEIQCMGIEITDRKQAEKALRENEERYRALIENAPDGIVLINTDGKFKYASPSVARIFGYTQEDLPQCDAVSLTHPDDLPLILSVMGRLLEQPTNIPILQYRFRHKNGEWRWIESTFSNLLALTSVEAIIINFRDIHERKLAEEALQKSQSLLTEAQRIGRIGHMEWNAQDAGLTCSDELYEILGVPHDTLITQRTFVDMMLPGEVERILQLDERAFELRTDTDYEYCLVRQDGSERWLHQIGKMTYTEAGVPTRMLAIIQDVSARKLTEDALKTEQMRLARVADTVPGAIVTFQLLPNGTLRIPYASKAFEDVYGIPLEDVADNIDAISAKVDPGQLSYLVDSIRESARTMQPWRNEYEYRHPKKGRVWIEGFSMPIKETDGSILWHGFSTDITKRKNAEVVLTESRSRVELALKGANAAMWDWNIKTGEAVFNERWAEMLGYTLQELQPISIDTWVKLCHPGDLKLSDQLLQKHFAGETEYYECEARMQHKNGSWIWVIDRGRVMEWDADNKPIRMFGTHLDITERKRDERYTEARLRLADLSYLEIDMDILLRTMLDEAEFITDSKIGFFHFVDDDQNTISLQSWSTNTVNTMCSAEGKGQHYPVAQAGVWADSIREGQPLIYNDYPGLPGRRELPDGHAPILRMMSLPIKRNNRIVAVIGVGNKAQDYDLHDLEFVRRLAEDAFDIILRKRAELQLRESEESFRTVADFTYDMEYWLDEKQNFVYLSPSCMRMTGYPRDEFLRDPGLLQRLIHPADRKDYEEHMAYEFNNPEPVSLDFRIITATGEERWVNHTCQGVSGAEGQPRGRRASNRDITGRKHSEAQVRRQMEDLALVNALNDAANRGESLETITEFLRAEFRRMFNCKDVSLYLLAPDQKSLDLQFFSLSASSRSRIEKLLGHPIPKVKLQVDPTGYFSRVIDSGRGLVTSDRQVLEQWMTEFIATPFLSQMAGSTIKPLIPQVFDLLGIHSVITIPLKSASQTLGAFEIASAGPLTEQDLDRLQNVRASLTEILRRKQIEQELMASEEKYRGLLESLDSVVLVVDSEGCFLYVNDVAAQQFGGKPADLIGRTIFDAFMGAYAQPEMERIRQVFREDRLIVQEVQFFIQGKTHWYRVSYQPIHDEDGQVAQVLINATDIDNIKTIQQELQELNRTLEERVRERTTQVQDLYDNAPVGYHSINSERRFIAINQTELNMLGYQRDELVGQISTIAFAPESAQVLSENFEHLLTEGKIVDMEVMARRKDGTTFPVLINAVATYDELGRFVSSRSTMTDITLRKLAENELKRNVNFTNALLDAIPTPVFYKQKDGNYLGCNRAFTEIMGKTSDQVRGRTVHQLWPTEHAELYHRKDLELMQKQERQVYESFVIDKNGKTCPVLFVKDIFCDETGLVAGLVGAFIDIAEHKRAEETLRHANVELARAMRIKDEFLANMSHELRTPLNGILGLSEALQLQTYGGLSEKQLRAVKNIESSGRHLLSLINDILDLSKIEAGKLEVHIEPISVVDICQASLAFIKEPALKKGIHTSFVSDPLAVTVLADVRRLKQILVNLLSNAVKFTPPGGRVTLNIQANIQKRMLEFCVSDTGIGISANDLAVLFQPFTQIDSSLTRKHEGTGLGLALVKELSELHGGNIQVSSQVGQGSTFTVCIPWQPDSLVLDALSVEENLEAPAQIAEVVPPKRPGKILMAEDVELNIVMVGDYLESQGYTFISAMNGREALEKAREQLPDIILMDVQMPEMDGLEATRQLRLDPRFATVPIIALTAMAMTGDRERCMEAGATDYISKPLVLRDLLWRIQGFLGELPAE